MSNIYLKFTIEKKLLLFDFENLKSSSPIKFLGNSNSLNIQTSCCNLKIKGLRAKLCVDFLSSLLWKELWRFKFKESMLFVGQKYEVW